MGGVKDMRNRLRDTWDDTSGLEDRIANKVLSRLVPLLERQLGKSERITERIVERVPQQEQETQKFIDDSTPENVVVDIGNTNMKERLGKKAPVVKQKVDDKTKSAIAKLRKRL
jgi:hypothetical protein